MCTVLVETIAPGGASLSLLVDCDLLSHFLFIHLPYKA